VEGFLQERMNFRLVALAMVVLHKKAILSF
jgi:hypothetical protein